MRTLFSDSIRSLLRCFQMPAAVCILLAGAVSLLIAQNGLDERQQNTDHFYSDYSSTRYLPPRIRGLEHRQKPRNVPDHFDSFHNRFSEDPSRWDSIRMSRDPLPSVPGTFANEANGAASGSTLEGVQESWVRHYGSGLITGVHRPSAIVIDSFGNVYMTGESEGDYATVKYKSTGEEQWAVRYNGPGNGRDIATAIAVDASGNVYVTGESDSSGLSSDFATIKYNSAGEEQWVVRYDGPQNSDGAVALAVDGSGNIYVTGKSIGAGTSIDYATVKYNSSGEEQWVRRYNGPGKSIDYPVALAVDASGNVYVTGWSAGSDTDYDYATVKYNSSGVELWVARYNGPENSGDYAASLAVDATGNVFVTGYSYSSGATADFTTVKYNSSGEQQWVARYNGPGNGLDYATALAVDASGNVYVTGGSVGSNTPYDYATIKYSSEGQEQWVRRYNGPGNGWDVSTALAVDGSGNIYITGKSQGAGTSTDYATVKYNSSGEEQWVVRYNGPGNGGDIPTALAVDASGNVHVTGDSYRSDTAYEYATVKYNSSGQEQWVASYIRPNKSRDRATALAVDASGNVYVTGESWRSDTTYDYATVKYNSSGVEQWVARYDGPGNDWNTATALAIDASGNVYVTGQSGGPETPSDYATVKYNNAGVEQWVRRYNGPGDGWDGATALAVDASGNVYVTGESRGSETYSDYATVKYSNSGEEQWVARYNGPGNDIDSATALAIDGSGNVYVTGASHGSGTSFDYATVKYNSSGEEQWVVRYNGPGSSLSNRDMAVAIAVDASGNVYVTGWSDRLGTFSDYTTVKYNGYGEEQWVVRYNGPSNGVDIPTALAIDASGNVYVTGWSSNPDTYYEYATVKYNNSGEEQWVARYNGPGNGLDHASALAVDASGNVYVTGRSAGSGTHYDYATVKYNSSGVEQWVARYNGPRNSRDFATALAVDASNNVYVAGYHMASNYFAGDYGMYTTIKYTQNPTSVEKIDTTIPDVYALEQNYPNPFNPSTTITFHIPVMTAVSLDLYNSLGQKVARLIHEEVSAGSHEVTFDASHLPSGVYIYRLQAGSYVESKRMLYLK
jgi:uncharacterized delta-60 repeat protein